MLYTVLRKATRHRLLQANGKVSGVESQATALPGVSTPQYGVASLAAIPMHRKARGARRNPARPKQNKTPFNFFSIDARARAKAEHADADQKVRGNGTGMDFQLFCLQETTGPALKLGGQCVPPGEYSLG